MSITNLIRAKQRDIIDRWSMVSSIAQRDDLPQLLEALAKSIEGTSVEIPTCARLGVAEYCNLRSIIISMMAAESPRSELRELLSLDVELDRLLAAAASRRSAEQRAELCALEERHRLLLEVTRVGMWDFEIQTRHIRLSARTRELFELPPGIEITEPRLLERVHPDDRAELRAHLQRAARGELTRDSCIAFRVIDHAGDLRWYECRGRTAYDAAGQPVEMFGTIQDITEQRVAPELQLRDEAAMLVTSQLLYDWNLLSNGLSFAGRSEDVLGLPLDEMPTDLDEFIARIHPEDRAAFTEQLDQVSTTRQRTCITYRIRCKDGSYIIAEDNGHFFFNPKYKPIRKIGSVMDVSRAKQIEEQRDNERRRAETLVELDRVKTEFFGNVSHELRTPLSLILGPVEDALTKPEKSLEGTSLSMVHRSALRLLHLVNQLLEFARMEQGRPHVTFVPTDLTGMTADLASCFRSLIERAGMKLVVECEDLPEPMYVDRSHWEKIVLNLLSNAFKYTLAGEIAVSLRWKEDHVELAVCDTGIGIPKHEIEDIFERFHRVQGRRGRTLEGSGIGLALVRELVTLHGGTVRVNSTENQGSTFVVSIPRGHEHLPADRISAGARSASPSVAAPYALQDAQAIVVLEHEDTPDRASSEPRRRILVADDNADMRDYVVRLLRPHWDVDAVADGRAALDAAKRCPPDLILTDVMMPHMDGLALVRVLRADPETAVIPVILLTARADEDSLLQALDAGADDYIVKPFSKRELCSRIGTHLRMVGISRAVAEGKASAHAQERLRILAEATAALSESLDYRVTISKIAQLAVPTLADWCMVDLISETGEVQRVEVAHADPGASEIAETLKRRDAGRTLVPGRPILLEPLPPDLFPTAAGVRSAMTVPLLARGRSLGALTLGVSRATPKYGVADLALVGELAHRCAIAIDNARLYAEARQAIHMRDEFLSIASHELRTPLASLDLALENLERRIRQVTPDEAAFEWIGSRLATAERQGKRLQRLANELLDVSRITGERLHLSLELVALTRVVKEVLAQLEKQGAVTRSSCTIDFRASGEAVGCWDGNRIHQIVTKLVENALKFGAGAPVEISVTEDRDRAELVVRDHGIGIATSDRNRIFSRFERAVPQRHYGGFGLGLWIVRQIVEAMSGTVHVESEVGQGATFTVRLPKQETPTASSPGCETQLYMDNSPH